MAEVVDRRFRRVVLQIDAATHCRETMGAAIEITARLGGELHGVFIENSDLATVGELDFIREFRLSSPTAHQLDRLTLQAQIRAMARSAQRQLEQAGRRRKITVGFQAIREDIWKADQGPLSEVDLIIVESTGRLHSRNFRDRFANRRPVTAMGRPTLLLKGSKSLTSKVAVVCDSLIAARHGIAAARSLLGISAEDITLFPYDLADTDQAELAQFAEGLRGETEGSATEQIRLAPPVPADGGRFLNLISPADSVVVVMSGGAFLENTANLEPLLTSRHPLLFIQ